MKLEALASHTEEGTYHGATEARKGRVLRVKRGYNPNSSSVGSDIPIFLAASAVAGVFATIALCIFDAKRRRKLDSTKEDEPPDTGESL